MLIYFYLWLNYSAYALLQVDEQQLNKQIEVIEVIHKMRNLKNVSNIQ